MTNSSHSNEIEAIRDYLSELRGHSAAGIRIPKDECSIRLISWQKDAYFKTEELWSPEVFLHLNWDMIESLAIPSGSAWFFYNGLRTVRLFRTPSEKSVVISVADIGDSPEAEGYMVPTVVLIVLSDAGWQLIRSRGWELFLRDLWTYVDERVIKDAIEQSKKIDIGEEGNFIIQVKGPLGAPQAWSCIETIFIKKAFESNANIRISTLSTLEDDYGQFNLNAFPENRAPRNLSLKIIYIIRNIDNTVGIF